MPRIAMATSAPRIANGTAIMTPTGSDQLSYCAARIRNTKIRPNTKARADVEPELTSSRASPDQS